MAAVANPAFVIFQAETATKGALLYEVDGQQYALYMGNIGRVVDFCLGALQSREDRVQWPRERRVRDFIPREDRNWEAGLLPGQELVTTEIEREGIPVESLRSLRLGVGVRLGAEGAQFLDGKRLAAEGELRTFEIPERATRPEVVAAIKQWLRDHSEAVFATHAADERVFLEANQMRLVESSDEMRGLRIAGPPQESIWSNPAFLASLVLLGVVAAGGVAFAIRR